MYVENGSMYERDVDEVLCISRSYCNEQGVTFSVRIRIQENWDEVIPLGDPAVWFYPPADVRPSIPATDIIVEMPTPEAPVEGTPE